jgi:hypothetical protein
MARPHPDECRECDVRVELSVLLRYNNLASVLARVVQTITGGTQQPLVIHAHFNQPIDRATVPGDDVHYHTFASAVGLHDGADHCTTLYHLEAVESCVHTERHPNLRRLDIHFLRTRKPK